MGQRMRTGAQGDGKVRAQERKGEGSGAGRQGSLTGERKEGECCGL